MAVLALVEGRLRPAHPIRPGRPGDCQQVSPVQYWHPGRGYSGRGVCLYAKKRLLFKANLDFKKYGTIGDFWEPGKSKKTLWQQIKDREKRIGEGLDDWSIRRLAKHVHGWFDGDVPLKEIERAFGYWHDEPAALHLNALPIRHLCTGHPI
jgi:hypothetical protein